MSGLKAPCVIPVAIYGINLYPFTHNFVTLSMSSNASSPLPETSVRDRYTEAANQKEAALCCPVDYDPSYLKVIPDEVIEKDYGCGDPSRFLKMGERVLDLGSGTGKICFIASQVVGPEGHVIGVDMTDDMLAVARRNAPVVAERIGYANVEFRKGRIQDLKLDLDRLEKELAARPVSSLGDYLSLEQRLRDMAQTDALIADNSIDVVVSNCVLNLVECSQKKQLFDEIFRVLDKGGRAVISDIVSDESVTREMREDGELWSGCISGAMTENEFLKAFEKAGFYGIRILKYSAEPWRTVKGIEFRSLTVEAFKGKQGACFERNQAVIYKGPFKTVLDDDGHRMERGKRYAVCDKTYNLYKHEPYRQDFEFIDPLNDSPLEEAKAFDCNGMRLRDPRETKGQECRETTEGSVCCEGPGPCC